ncbi:MAG: MFS transporter [Solobacterium sp.]|nr:MFS transporter [Solobacterium sp.]MBQ6533305.1 MFS transporter [Solobacterium sp.]MBR0214046.1 MFS transporter [Solobacterium sp.]
MRLTGRQKAAYGIGAIGKDMVYALSASYVMYYYQDIMGLSASFVGFILMIARVFDAVNDPFMGILVAKTQTKWGRFRPWLFSGTVLNAFVLYALFKAPNLAGTGLMAYFSVIYILWGMTYTMMDIPYWSMIPAVTDTPQDRENLSVVGRTCAGVGNALITVFTVKAVAMLGAGSERMGFGKLALIVAVLFIITEVITCLSVKEQRMEKMQTNTIPEMFRALFANDQAMVTVMTIILINCALYLTSNLIIYFFKYDLGGASWQDSYTLFNMVGGASQILGMMVLYPLLRRKFGNTDIFKMCLRLAITGYALILLVCLTGFASNVILLCLCGLCVFLANGMMTVLTTVFLSSSVDYGELKTGHREESVIFSMQTFVVKAASGVAVFMTGIGLDLIGLTGSNATDGIIEAQSASTILGLRLLMTILPVLGLLCAYAVFTKKFTLTDEKVQEISTALREKAANDVH